VAKGPERRRIPTIKVQQWLNSWTKIDFSSKAYRRKPEPHFFLFSMPAVELRSLCGIARRQASELAPRAADLGIQREHDPDRSEEIAQFVEFGYPWSTLSAAKRRSNEFNDLRKPGWLPTAIVVNILSPSDERNDRRVATNDLVSVENDSGAFRLELPYGGWSKDWRPSSVAPMEVIDGQHRLWAFDSSSDPSFELPVVAFQGLDISWQAYLFWTVNIKPKRINPSLAFDLYPLLRAEDWLDRGEGHSVYRETRSQELTEALWSHPESPWYDRINMLGERGVSGVTQSAWIKSLMATLVRPWLGRGSSTGGLFGSRLREGDEVLGWSRAQQAAFLIYAWKQLYVAVRDTNAGWAKHLRAEAKRDREQIDDPEFYGPYSLVVTDQGVRGYLHVLNDICILAAPKLDLRSWRIERSGSASDASAVTLALNSLSKHPVASFVAKLAKGLARQCPDQC
jgi:DGQHR domain-containing protein